MSRYYVIKIFGKIKVYDRNQINLLIDSGILRKTLKESYNLTKFALYYTK